MPQPSVSIEADGRLLRLVADTGECLEVEACTLWVNCPSALRRRRRLHGLDACAPSTIGIVRIAPVGNYAVTIAFNDGHDRGIYPWSLLQALARRPKADDFLIPFPSVAGAESAPTSHALGPAP